MSRNFSVTTGRDGRRSFGEHDDRWNDSGGGSRGGGGYRGNKGYQKYRGGQRGGYNSGGSRGGSRGYRRGSGKSYYNNNRGRGGGGGGGPGPRSRLDSEGDFSMNDGQEASSSSRRYNPYSRPNRGPRPSSSYDRNSSGKDYGKMSRLGLPVDRGSSSHDQWFKVMIPKGIKGGKDFIIQSLNERLNTPFQPVNFHFEQDKAVFYVQDKHESNAIQQQNKQITMPNGFKMIIIVNSSKPPVFAMDEEGIEKLKLCMSKRYDPASKALNLSCLAKDQDLVSANLYMALSRGNVMNNVVKIVEENIPELEAFDISENKISYLGTLAALPKKAVNVKKLNLGKNKLEPLDISENKISSLAHLPFYQLKHILNHIQELEKIKDWKLEELILDGNDLCDKFQDQNSYISAVRKKFPKLKTLDGHDLPPPITFDLDASAELPPNKGSYFVNDEVKQVVVQFLKQYFTFYDSDNRQPLLEAYSDQSLFSLSVTYNPSIEYSQPKLTEYIPESRNLLKTGRDTTGVRRNKLLKRGKLNIVAQLSLMPKTTHDYNSFVVDVDHVSTNLLSFSVDGVFKEADSKSDNPPVRAFSRRFVALPCGQGMVLENDMLTITNASREQLQAAFKHPAPTPSSSPVPEASPAAPFPQAGPAYTQEQQQMIQQFSTQSHMNHEWSAKCLEQNSWNYERAGENFVELQKQNKIPQEAFNK